MALFKKKKKKEATEGEDPAKDEEKEGGKDEKKEEKKEESAEESKDEKAEGEGEAGAEGDEAGKPADKKKKIKKLAIIGGGAAVLLIVLGAGAFFMFGGKGKTEATSAKSAGEASTPVYFDLPQILVNLNTGGKGPSFIKASITLELTAEADMELAKANLPRLLDSYNTFLREMKTSDLYGSAGVYRLREEMLLRANTLLAPVRVKDVLFKELLVQ